MKQNLHAYTSITNNYLPKARVLARSLKAHNPDVQFHLLLSDDPIEGFNLADEPFDSLILAEQLVVEDQARFFFSHSVVELCTAVKGLALEFIFERYQADAVFYFDPDMALFSNLDRLLQHFEQHSILLTPHQCEPETSRQAVIDNEMCSLRYGVFNLGFVGVQNDTEGRRFARWWRDRLVDFCFDDVQRGLFTDQKWVNLAPCFFDRLKILRDPVYNVATWNLTHRQVAGSLAEGVSVNDQPLCFYHFSGFDSGSQAYMLNKYGKGNSTLLALRNWYIEQCQQQGQAALGKLPCKYANYSDGTPITSAERIEYRNRPELQAQFPQPFEAVPGKPCYRSWFIENAPQAAGHPAILSVAPTASFRDVFFAVADYFYSVSYSERASSSAKRWLLRNFARLMHHGGKLLFK